MIKKRVIFVVIAIICLIVFFLSQKENRTTQTVSQKAVDVNEHAIPSAHVLNDLPDRTTSNTGHPEAKPAVHLTDLNIGEELDLQIHGTSKLTHQQLDQLKSFYEDNRRCWSEVTQFTARYKRTRSVYDHDLRAFKTVKEETGDIRCIMGDTSSGLFKVNITNEQENWGAVCEGADSGAFTSLCYWSLKEDENSSVPKLPERINSFPIKDIILPRKLLNDEPAQEAYFSPDGITLLRVSNENETQNLFKGEKQYLVQEIGAQHGMQHCFDIKTGEYRGLMATMLRADGTKKSIQYEEYMKSDDEMAALPKRIIRKLSQTKTDSRDMIIQDVIEFDKLVVNKEMPTHAFLIPDRAIFYDKK